MLVTNWKKDRLNRLYPTGDLEDYSFESNDYYSETFGTINERLKLAGVSLRGRMLEVGCGDGTFLQVSRGESLDGYGVNPRIVELMKAKQKGLSGYVVQAVGESLPFRDDVFDSVVSMSVLEHVYDPASVLSESVRVLARKGALYVGAPDYSKCFYEGHYRTSWFPMPKRLARIYLKLKGRKGSDLETLLVQTPLDSLNFTTKHQLVRLLRSHHVHVVDLNKLLYLSVRKDAKPYFRERINDPNRIKSTRLRKLLKLFLKVGLSNDTLLAVTLIFYLPLLRLRSAISPEINLLAQKL